LHSFGSPLSSSSARLEQMDPPFLRLLPRPSGFAGTSSSKGRRKIDWQTGDPGSSERLPLRDGGSFAVTNEDLDVLEFLAKISRKGNFLLSCSFRRRHFMPSRALLEPESTLSSVRPLVFHLLLHLTLGRPRDNLEALSCAFAQSTPSLEPEAAESWPN
jgi:hypothetical protein